MPRMTKRNHPNLSRRGKHYFTITTLEQALAAGSPRFGDAGRNILTGPGLFNWDLALIKDFALREHLKLQFRAESYNTTIRPYFLPPNSTVGARSSARSATRLVLRAISSWP